MVLFYFFDYIFRITITDGDNNIQIIILHTTSDLSATFILNC